MQNRVRSEPILKECNNRIAYSFPLINYSCNVGDINDMTNSITTDKLVINIITISFLPMTH